MTEHATDALVEILNLTEPRELRRQAAREWWDENVPQMLAEAGIRGARRVAARYRPERDVWMKRAEEAEAKLAILQPVITEAIADHDSHYVPSDGRRIYHHEGVCAVCDLKVALGTGGDSG